METGSATTQAISYIPYGEVFVEQQASGWSSPYLFNAKELDSETGLYYYGARYLDPSDAMWLSVDPLWEKYVGMSPYQYCAGNPVKLIDVEGRYLGINIGDESFSYDPTIGDNTYSGDNEVIKETVNSLNTINSTSAGNAVLTDLHTSNRKYIISNASTNIKSGASTVPTFDDNGELSGTILNANNLYSNVEVLGHELFHSYQYENGQGGASIFNEIEAYTFQYIIAEQLNTEVGLMFFPEMSACTARDEVSSTFNGKLFEQSFSNLIYDRFSEKNFNNAMNYFREYSSANAYCTYDKPYYSVKLESNKEYLINRFTP